MASVDFLAAEQWPSMNMKLCWIPARELVRITKVSTWRAGSGKKVISGGSGYQRRLRDKKARGIVDDLIGSTQDSPLPMPSALVLSARKGVRIRNKKIILPGGPDWHIVDAQHRLEAFRIITTDYPGHKSIIDMPLPVVLLDKWSALDEGWMFWVINTKATKIDTSLGLVIFARLVQEKRERGTPRTARILACIELTEEIITSPNTVWDDVIIMPDDPDRQRGKSLLSFSTAVRSFGTFIWPAWPWANDSISDIAETLNWWWGAWFKAMPQVVQNAGEYALVGSSGFNALNKYGSRLMAAIWPVETPGQFDNLVQQLSQNLGGSDFWLREGKFRELFLRSSKNPKRLIDALINATPERIRTLMGEIPSNVKAPFS